MATTTYSIIVVSNNSRHGDGSPVIERDCGHRHRTLAGAERCHRQLTKRQPDGMYRADFYRSEIRRADGTRLTEDEADALLDMQQRAA